MKVLQNTIRCEETICTNRSLSGKLKLAAPYVYPDYATYSLATFAKNVWAGKHLDIYVYSHPRTSVLPVLTIWIHIS